MSLGLILLLVEALAVYGLVFTVHAIRDRFTLLPYYGLLGVLAATLRWTTDAGIVYELGPLTLILGSVVFFTSLLFGVFLLYLFDGVKAAQIGIYTVVAVSMLSPLLAKIFYYQLSEMDAEAAGRIILGSPRLYVASTAAMVIDFLCMSMVWEVLGRRGNTIPYLFRIAICLLTAYWLDALLFSFGAFWGDPNLGSILSGNLISRAVLTVCVAPLVTMYVVWEARRHHYEITPRRVMALLHQSARTELDLSDARHEIEVRKRIEEELRRRDAILRSLAYTAEHYLNGGRDAIGMAELLMTLGSALGVSRASICENGDTGGGVLGMKERFTWTAPPPALPPPAASWEGMSYGGSGLARWERLLAGGEAISGNVRDFPQEEQRALLSRGILSILVLPVIVQEAWWGFITFEVCERDRPWARSEIDALRTAAGTLGAAIHQTRIEEALRATNERLDLALEAGDLGLWDWDIESDLVVFNEQWARMLGYTLRDLEPTMRAWRNLIHPEDLLRLRANMLAHLKGETPAYEVETRMRSQDGGWHWILSKGKVVSRDGRGRALRATGTHLDITLRKETEQAIAEARAYEREIETRIEETLLRGRPPVWLDGVEIAAVTVPSQHMDGDFAEFIPLNPQCFDVLVGDVMGKGIFAALVSAGAKSRFLHALASQLAASRGGGYPSPADLVGAVHRDITRQLIDLDCFLTLSYARFDLAAGRVTYVDCGHTKTIRYRVSDHSCMMLEGDNVPIGFLEAEAYAERQTDLQPGDLFVFYSDGLTETRDPEGSFFGVERLLEVIRVHASLEPSRLTRKVVDVVAQFSGSNAPGDDQTCVAVKILEVGEEPGRGAERRSILAYPENLLAARTFLQDHLAAHTALLGGQDDFSRIVLAFVEALSNIIKHSFGGGSGKCIDIELRSSRNRLRIEITHGGTPFRPRSTPLPDPRERREGGYGLYIMNRCFDQIVYETNGAGAQCIILLKHFSPEWLAWAPETAPDDPGGG